MIIKRDVSHAVVRNKMGLANFDFKLFSLAFACTSVSVV